MTPDIAVDTEENCIQRYRGEMLGVNSQKLLDAAHYLSAGMVSFARGLNDTPKIVALLLTLSAAGLKLSWAMFAVAVAMAAGGLFNARKVAETMSRRITPLNHGQGFTANLVTAFLVTLASRWGLPVSTTHASCGSLFGIGLITQKGDLSVMRNIVLSWVLTLPVAAALSAISYWGLTR
jgi:PiT family inorganic phosphate transporter